MSSFQTYLNFFAFNGVIESVTEKIVNWHVHYINGIIPSNRVLYSDYQHNLFGILIATTEAPIAAAIFKMISESLIVMALLTSRT